MPPPLVASAPDLGQSVKPFWRRLDEAVAWCGPRANPEAARDCLRSPELRPRILQPSYTAGVADLLLNREHALGRNFTVPTDSVATGRLLVYGPDEELSDGAAEEETNGFFDVANCPPWDTWVAFVEEPHPSPTGRIAYLVSWVPPEFVESVGRGIYVNPEGCIRWLEDSTDAFAKYLAQEVSIRARGLTSA
jgi:hypothetical protein